MSIRPEMLSVAHPAYARWQRFRTPTSGTLNDHWASHLKADPSLREVVLCFELVFGPDHYVRISNRPCNVTSTKSGEVYTYHPVISDKPTFTQSYTFGDSSSSARSMSISVPNSYVDVAKLVSYGRMLAGVAEVSLQVDGGNYDERFVLMRGDMQDGVTFASIDELVTVTITDPKTSLDVHTPPFVIVEEAFNTTPADTAIGSRYPIIFPRYDGVPAQYLSTASGAFVVLVSHGHMDDQSGAVIINGVSYPSTDATYGYTWTNTEDNFGNQITTIQFNATASFTNEQVYAFPYVDGGDKHPLAQIKELLLKFTAIKSIGLSEDLFSRAIAKLQTMESRLMINAGKGSTATALKFIETEFLPSFPMLSMVFHGTGYGPVVTDRRSDVIVAKFVADRWPILDRASAVTETPKSECCNEFSIVYDYDPIQDVYQKIATRNSANSALCEISTNQLGYRPADVIESRYIFEDDSAAMALDWMADHKTLPAYLVDYAMDASMILKLNPGDKVLITDSEFSWEEVSATVDAIKYNCDHCIVTLRVWWRYYLIGTGAQNFNQGGYIGRVRGGS